MCNPFGMITYLAIDGDDHPRQDEDGQDHCTTRSDDPRIHDQAKTLTSTKIKINSTITKIAIEMARSGDMAYSPSVVEALA